MDITPRKGTPPLSSPKSSAIPDHSLSGSRETNENEQPLDQKPVTKNFMSPTISAASKASDPIIKRILAERNELSSSCESLPHKASNLGSKANSLNSTSHRFGKLPISSYSYASESDNDQENNYVVDSSYKPYDPLTNDLGPRPKYLRYQPNRRRVNFLPQEGCSLLAPQKSNDNEEPSNLPEKYNLELENEDVRDSVEEDEEEEMEEVVDREWSLKGIFKLLLLLVVFFLSSTNLSSRNPMATSDTGNVIRKNIFEAVVDEIYGSVYMDQPEDSQSGFLELSQREVNYEHIVELLEVESAEMEKSTEPQEGQSADIDIDQEDSTEVEVIQSAHSDEEEETISTAAGQVTSSNEVNKEEVEGFVEQLQRDHEQENLEVLLDDISSTCANEQNAAHSSSKFELAAVDNKIEQVENISQEQAEEVETETEFEISNLDTEIESENAEVKEIGPSNTVLFIGVSAASVIASVEGEFLERKTVKVSFLQEPLNDPSENRRNSHLERTPAIGSITQASSLCVPKKEASKEISHISAPKIELLGELMVGEVSSSLRNCVGKNSMTEAEGSNTNLSKGVLPPAQPSVVEHSVADSPSYGSFTAEKILKKKVEKDGEEVKKVALATPVRRSSRIRDRVGMSP